MEILLPDAWLPETSDKQTFTCLIIRWYINLSSYLTLGQINVHQTGSFTGQVFRWCPHIRPFEHQNIPVAGIRIPTVKWYFFKGLNKSIFYFPLKIYDEWHFWNYFFALANKVGKWKLVRQKNIYLWWCCKMGRHHASVNINNNCGPLVIWGNLVDHFQFLYVAVS